MLRFIKRLFGFHPDVYDALVAKTNDAAFATSEPQPKPSAPVPVVAPLLVTASRLSIAQWQALDAPGQLDMWLAVQDSERGLYRPLSTPAAQLVFECVPTFTGDVAGDRVRIKEALRRGDWINNPRELSQLCADDDSLSRFVENLKWAENARRNWEQGLDGAVVDMWPACRLIAATGRMKPGTQARWIEAGGRLHGGKMVALKKSSVWARFSIFGRPHPPYDNFSHHLVVEDVDRDEAVRFRLVSA